MKKKEMGRPYGKSWEKDRYMQGFGREIREKEAACNTKT
jgi:hypothetical protein